MQTFAKCKIKRARQENLTPGIALYDSTMESIQFFCQMNCKRLQKNNKDLLIVLQDGPVWVHNGDKRRRAYVCLLHPVDSFGEVCLVC